jgi:hypothetical protein
MTDSAADEAFGHFLNRPDHPDFWRISSILLKLDGRMQEADESERDEVYENNVARWVDGDTLNYSAIQRAMRPLGVVTRNDLIKYQDKVVVLSAMWQEGFQVGAEFVTETIEGKTIAELNEIELRLLLSNYEKHVMERARENQNPLSVADFFNALGA